MRRPPGHASPEEHPKGSGRWRVRARIEGNLKTIGSNLSEAEAKETADAYAVVRNEAVLREGITLDQFGAGALDRRERSGVRGIKAERSRWKTYMQADPIGSLPVSTLVRRDLVEWRDRMLARKLQPQTRKNSLNLLRAVLEQAVERELLEANPAREVKFPRYADATDRDELEGIMTPSEQLSLLQAVPERERDVVLFALFGGLRQSSQWFLKAEDCRGDHVLLRRHKSKRPRTLYMLEPARRALARSLARGSKWAFPAARGGRRPDGKPPRGWHSWVKAAGIDRRVRWHDLRHTCATSLLAGWWGGRKWSLDEVCSYLGHSSVKVTERYARKLQESQRLAIAQTVFPESSHYLLPGSAEPARIQQRCGSDSNRRMMVLQGAGAANGSATLQRVESPPGNMCSPAVWALVLAAEGIKPRARSSTRWCRPDVPLQGIWLGRRGRAVA